MSDEKYIRSVEETMSAYHAGERIGDDELTQARMALEQLSGIARLFGAAMRPIVYYANITADNMRSMERARAERRSAGK